MKKHKKICITVVSLVLIIGLTAIAFLNSNAVRASVLKRAIERKDLAKIEEIIEKTPDVINYVPFVLLRGEYRAYTPLTMACKVGDIEIVQMLMGAGANVNLSDGADTPLSITYHSKNGDWYDISLLLLEQGACLDYTCHRTYQGSLEVVRDILIGSHACTKQDNENIRSAFLYALEHLEHDRIDWNAALRESVSYERHEVVTYLLENGFCDVNADIAKGMTALMFAARDSNAEMVTLLLSYGADKTVASENGKTAYEYAVEFNKDPSVAVLLAP